MWYRSYGLVLLLIAVLLPVGAFRHDDVLFCLAAGGILLIDLPLRWLGSVVPWREYDVPNRAISAYRGSQVYFLPTWVFGAAAMLIGVGLFVARQANAPTTVAQGALLPGKQPDKEAPPKPQPPAPPKPPGKKTLAKEDIGIDLQRSPRSYKLSVTNKLKVDLDEAFIGVTLGKGGAATGGWAWPKARWRSGQARVADQPVRWVYRTVRLRGEAVGPDGTVYEFDHTWTFDE